MFTGKYAKHNKRVGYQDGVSWEYKDMLAERLSQAGYQTQCVGKMHVHPPRNNCGFQNVKLHDGYLGYYRRKTEPYYLNQLTHDDYIYFLKDKKGQSADITETGIDPNSRIAYPWPYEEELHPSNWCTTESIRFLETRNREKPFFLMASYVRPHQPFDAPAAYQAIYKDKQLRPPFVGSWESSENTEKYSFIKDSVFGTHHAESMDLAMKGYYANITHVDSQIGRLLMALEEDGSFEDTLIVFVSDHGELLFDHHLYRKAFPYQWSVRIPLMFKLGKNIAKSAPIMSESLVSLADLMPTLLDFAKAEEPNDMDGISLKDEILLGDARTHDFIHGEHAFAYSASNQFIVTKEDKYIWYSETEEEQYFVLKNDPNELMNEIKSPVYQDRIAFLRKTLINELKGRPEGFVKDGALVKSADIVDVLP